MNISYKIHFSIPKLVWPIIGPVESNNIFNMFGQFLLPKKTLLANNQTISSKKYTFDTPLQLSHNNKTKALIHDGHVINFLLLFDLIQLNKYEMCYSL